MSSILAFDTSAEACSVCLKAEQESFSTIERVPRKHAQLLLPMIDSVLDKSQLRLNQLDALAFGCGPGSFTGLRIAAGVAQGLSYGSGLTVFQVSNLQAMAIQARKIWPDAEYVLVAFDARMDEVYTGLFSFGADSVPKLIGEEQVLAPELVLGGKTELLSHLQEKVCRGIGSGFNLSGRFPEATQQLFSTFDASVQPEAWAIAELANQKVLDNESGVSPEEIKPSYLRNEVSWKKLPGKG